jgi:hypothetical protein
MDRKRWIKIENILNKALDLDNQDQREKLVAHECKDDKQLYRQVSNLLRSIRKAEKESFLEQS